jgi:hypothetical protein
LRIGSHLCVQQPDEIAPVVSPELVGPPVLELPIALPVIVLPVHWLEEVILTPVDEVMGDAGTVIIGLTPALSISVASSGTVPPASSDPGTAPGVKSGEAMPVDETDAGSQPLDDMPPPSKVEPVELWEAQASGLKPPGLISVAPSGMPVGAPDVAEPRAFSGDVAPSADLLGKLCA